MKPATATGYRVLDLSCLAKSLTAVALAASVGVIQAQETAIVLDAQQLDQVVAGDGERVRPNGWTYADAGAEGRDTFTYTKTYASVEVAEETPMLSEGTSSTYVSNYGVAYANARGEGATHRAVTQAVNEQPGLTAGPGVRTVYLSTPYSSYSVVSGQSVSSIEIDRHSLMQRNLPW